MAGCLALQCQPMSRKGQASRSTNPEDYQQVPRAIAAMPKDFDAGFEILPHRHRRAQLIHATAGTMRVSTDDGVWMVPPQRALWMPAGCAAQHRHAGRHHNAHALRARRRGR